MGHILPYMQGKAVSWPHSRAGAVQQWDRVSPCTPMSSLNPPHQTHDPSLLCTLFPPSASSLEHSTGPEGLTNQATRALLEQEAFRKAGE